MVMQTTTLALGQSPLPIAIRWDFHFKAEDNLYVPRDCCLNKTTEGCAALIALRSALYRTPHKVEALSVVLDLMVEEWEQRFGRMPYRTREQVRPWLLFGLIHAQPGEFRLGRMTRQYEFVEVEPGELGTLYNLDAYRDGDR